jgi:O-acetyl-ADP-ribose deacetylase (regulator of RNase III)
MVQTVQVEPSVIVYNCFTQEFYGREAGRVYGSVPAIRTCLTSVFMSAKEFGKTLHLPRIGCGLAGLSWDKDVEPVVRKLCGEYPHVRVIICDKA